MILDPGRVLCSPGALRPAPAAQWPVPAAERCSRRCGPVSAGAAAGAAAGAGGAGRRLLELRPAVRAWGCGPASCSLRPSCLVGIKSLFFYLRCTALCSLCWYALRVCWSCGPNRGLHLLVLSSCTSAQPQVLRASATRASCGAAILHRRAGNAPYIYVHRRCGPATA